MNSVVLPNSKVIDCFGRFSGNLLFLLEEDIPEIQPGTRLRVNEQDFVVQEIIHGSRSRVGIRVLKS